MTIALVFEWNVFLARTPPHRKDRSSSRSFGNGSKPWHGPGEKTTKTATLNVGYFPMLWKIAMKQKSEWSNHKLPQPYKPLPPKKNCKTYPLENKPRAHPTKKRGRRDLAVVSALSILLVLSIHVVTHFAGSLSFGDVLGLGRSGWHLYFSLQRHKGSRLPAW